MRILLHWGVWSIILGFAGFWEIYGFVTKRWWTLTDVIRSFVPVWVRWVALAILVPLLVWHFCIAKANFPQ